MQLAFGKMGGLVPAVIQDYRNGNVLMLGFVNEHALVETQRTGEVHFYSRSRNRLWKKGETSGHVLRVKAIRMDCDADALLIQVEPIGPGVCHKGYHSCFFRQLDADGRTRIIAERAFDAENVYGQSGAE